MKQSNFHKPFDPENHVKLLVHRVICLCLLEKRHFDHAIQEVFRFDKTINASMREAAFLLSRRILRDLLFLKSLAEISGELDESKIRNLVFFAFKNSDDPYNEDFNQEKISVHTRFSFPGWLWKRGLQENGEELWLKTVLGFGEIPPMYLRVNTLKISMRELQSEFKQKDIRFEVFDHLPDAIRVYRSDQPFLHPTFKLGCWEVQDLSSQEVVKFMAVKPEHRVIDACAGSGGKTLYLAAEMQNKGKLIALDKQQGKLTQLKNRLKRAGVNNTEVRWIENSKVLKRLAATADRLLLDVPCSGTGVIGRNPDIKWHLTEASLEELLLMQSLILKSYSPMVKPGGEMVYSTCSIFPSEGEQQVANFLNNHPQWTLLEQKRSGFPFSLGDGFFMARLKKNNS